MDRKIMIVNQAIQYIEENLSEKMKVADVAAALHYSKYHLHRLFIQTTGITIHDYIQRRQLTKGADLLAHTQMPIIEVAGQAGYETQQAFTTVFRSMYKRTPKQFREKGEYYPLQLEYSFAAHSFDKRERYLTAYPAIRPAVMEDISIWMALVDLVVDGFPCLNKNRYIYTLKKYIAVKQAFIMSKANEALGIMLVDNKRGAIDFLGIHPLYRDTGIDRMFVAVADKHILNSRFISITTYREGDKADTGYRKALQKIGFREDKFLVEFGYPTQRFLRERR